MASEKIVTASYKLESAKNFIASFDDNTYYVFASKHTEYDAEPTPDVPYDNESYKTAVWREMIFGKKITSDNLSLVIPRVTWTSNTVYAQYDDADTALLNKNFYVTVNEGDYYHTYKCLYNNESVASTVEPSFAAVSLDDEVYETADGYIWKYLYTVNNTVVSAFATADYFPVTTNTSVSEAASVGAIDVIKVVSGGEGYDNYIAGENLFASNQLRLGGNALIFDVSSNTTASSYNDFYNGCYIYIVSGTGAGQYKKILDYISNSTTKAIVIESAFTNAISIDSVYNIYPGVVISSDGTQTVNAAARAIVNAYSNSIYKIDMLNRGERYSISTANVYAHDGVGASNSELRVINSPYAGHGSYPPGELGATRLMLSATFANTESNTIPVTNDFRTIGVLKNPLFSNVVVETYSKSGEFINGETVFKFTRSLASPNCTFAADSNTITANTADFNSQFSVGDRIYINKGSSHFHSTVHSITNSSVLVMTSAVAFSANSDYPANVYRMTVTSNASVLQSNATHTCLANVAVAVATGDKYIGANSLAYMVANSSTRSGETKGLDTFKNMYNCIGSIVSGSFQHDETVYQSNVSTANATFHSTEVIDSVRSFYLTNVYGGIDINLTLIGANSGAVADINTVYNPELVFKSGDIIYVENIEAVERSASQSEKFKLMFVF